MAGSERDADPPVGPTLGEVGEAGVLAAIVPLLPPPAGTLVGPGDDAAVLASSGRPLVATTDALVEGRDFRLDWSSGADVGWKAAAQNLADVAAMGAVPTALLVTLVAPPDLPLAFATGLAEGLAAGCAGSGAGVVGGDLSSGAQVVVSVTALGEVGERGPVLRSGARPGDVVAVAGRLGLAAAGLDLLHAGRQDASPEAVEAQRRPRPPLAAGPAAAAAGATAMLDVSDGLVRDLRRVALASGVAVDLDPAALVPWESALADAAAALERPDAPRGWVLTGGEDHALAATFPPDVPLPDPFVPVGVVRAGAPDVLLAGEPVELAGGWDHFGG